ncbi:hypothetical protein QF026_002477 [Streptomyces aurantiacus]|nr:hypothetical protein [Streptomyces aurantiacus]
MTRSGGRVGILGTAFRNAAECTQQEVLFASARLHARMRE